ncbi:MFS transporter [Brevibacterium moorei]|uniref:MFS transporter n=1 Tax=Brevibacterium moorei TaxID=2968457 RepID=UPI00211C612A|nr:MFS transporter [Brevibacterium sp. 68QC2CO]MCQ9385722.1 MFS transporter [Brevibacterium sp. 68QC2CO]
MSLRIKPNWSERPLLPIALGTALVLVTYVTPMATLPSAAGDLGAGTSARAWILSAMSVGLAGGLLAAGLLGDRFGRRGVYAVGLSAVAVGALGCAVAWNPAILIGSRILQGFGGAAVIACGLAILAHSYPAAQQRAHATSIWGASIGAGIAGGSLLAMLLDLAAGWRSNYVVTAVLGALLLAGTLVTLPASRATRLRPVDVPGLVLLVAGTVLLVAALTQLRHGVTVSFVVLALSALCVLGVLGIVEARVRHPLIEPGLLRAPRVLAATIGALTVGVGTIGMTSFLPTVAQSGFGASLQLASLPPLVWAVASTFTAIAVRWLPFPVEGPWAVAILLALTSGFMLTAVGAESVPRLILPMVLIGITSGLLNSTLGREAVASVPADHAATGSGANNTARYLGAACGITLFTIIATATTQDIVDGWSIAVFVAAGLTVLGALLIVARILIRTRRPGT